MNNYPVTQTSLINNISSHFLSGNIILDGIFAILISSFVTALFGLISLDNIKPSFRKFKRWVFKKHTFVINYGYTKDTKGWSIDPDNKDNCEIIDSIEHYLSTHKYECLDTKVFIKSSELLFLPNSKIKLSSPYEDIEMQIYNSNTGDKENIRIERKIVLTSSGNDKIKKFLSECMSIWTEKENEKQKNKKYFYTHYYDRSTIIFNKYELKTRKSFDDIFFPEKKQLLSLLDKFDAGKLNTPKFSLLMYGPPGTGKTSIIKALSNYMGRSICYVKLSDIRNFQDLFEIFFTSHITTFHFRYKTHTVKPQEKIIVLEDIDVESDTTHKREKNKENDDGFSDAKKKAVSNDADVDKLLFKKSLNLSDILQVLDGVYENTDTMIVITTNNIEKLDPALIRPGRITMKLHMRELTRHCAFETISKFFPHDKLTNRFNIIKDYTMTPAQLESFCLQSNSMNELFKLVEDHYK
jgi:hypothetical protein